MRVKKFEEQFSKSLKKAGIKVLRLIDPPSSFGKDSKEVRFSAKNPYDFECYNFPYLYCLELKSKASTSLSIQSKEDAEQKKSADIKYHQITALQEANEYQGVFAGFVINFRSTNHTYWINIVSFSNFLINENKKSINENDAKAYGVLIDQKIVRTTYSYDIKKWVDEIITIKSN